MKTEKYGALRASFINPRRRHHTFQFSLFPFQFKLLGVFLLFTPKNLHLLKFFVLLHQLEKSELKNAEGR